MHFLSGLAIYLHVFVFEDETKRALDPMGSDRSGPYSGQVLWGLDGAGEESPRRGQHHVRSLVIRPERVDRQCPLVSRAPLLQHGAMACPGSFRSDPGRLVTASDSSSPRRRTCHIATNVERVNPRPCSTPNFTSGNLPSEC